MSDTETVSTKHGSAKTWFKTKLFHFPSLANSPTNSRENLANRSTSVDSVDDERESKPNIVSFSHSPGAYRKTLAQLEDLRKRHPRLGSTSDYLNMTSSACSEDDFLVGKSNFDSLNVHMQRMDDEDEELVSSYLDIKACTKGLEDRNAELLNEPNADDKNKNSFQLKN